MKLAKMVDGGEPSVSLSPPSFFAPFCLSVSSFLACDKARRNFVARVSFSVAERCSCCRKAATETLACDSCTLVCCSSVADFVRAWTRSKNRQDHVAAASTTRNRKHTCCNFRSKFFCLEARELFRCFSRSNCALSAEVLSLTAA